MGIQYHRRCGGQLLPSLCWKFLLYVKHGPYIINWRRGTMEFVFFSLCEWENFVGNSILRCRRSKKAYHPHPSLQDLAGWDLQKTATDQRIKSLLTSSVAVQGLILKIRAVSDNGQKRALSLVKRSPQFSLPTVAECWMLFLPRLIRAYNY